MEAREESQRGAVWEEGGQLVLALKMGKETMSQEVTAASRC